MARKPSPTPKNGIDETTGAVAIDLDGRHCRMERFINWMNKAQFDHTKATFSVATTPAHIEHQALSLHRGSSPDDLNGTF